MGISLKDLARTVRDWLSAKQRVPWWVPEYMRRRQMEQADIRRQMNMTALGPRLGVVPGDVIELATRRPKKEPQVTGLRLDDYDQVQIAR
jgi:hypothetical protein